MAKRFTDRTYRSRATGNWVKVTRDNKERTFTHAYGHQGDYSAHRIETLSFKWIANWAEAEQRANRYLYAL